MREGRVEVDDAFVNQWTTNLFFKLLCSFRLFLSFYYYYQFPCNGSVCVNQACEPARHREGSGHMSRWPVGARARQPARQGLQAMRSLGVLPFPSQQAPSPLHLLVSFSPSTSALPTFVYQTSTLFGDQKQARTEPSMVVLNVTAGAHGSRSLKLRSDDSPQSLRERIASKLVLPSSSASEWTLKYEWIGVSRIASGGVGKCNLLPASQPPSLPPQPASQPDPMLIPCVSLGVLRSG